MRLEVPAFRQEQSHTCLPACLRVVLAYLGRRLPEAELAALCGTRRVGTSLRGALEALDELGCDALYLPRGTLEDLALYLSADRPVIAFLRLEELGAGIVGSHAVVVCGLTETNVWVVDPSAGDEVALEVEVFLRSWSAQGSEGLVVLELT
jgi:ATP-binding cassette, subfamily B, bacterial